MFVDKSVLKENPSFRMTGAEFKNIIDSMTVSQENEDQIPVRVALTVRTSSTNLVARQHNSVVCTSPLDYHGLQGYFNVTSQVKTIINTMFPMVSFEEIKSTVLMPIGMFMYQDMLHVYLHLILQDDQMEKFTALNMDYPTIKDLYFDFNLDSPSLMVLPTLKIVNNKK